MGSSHRQILEHIGRLQLNGLKMGWYSGSLSQS
jgi:hypothetical protein